MNANEAMAYYETRRKIAALNGDDTAEQHWADRIQRVSDQQEARRATDARDELIERFDAMTPEEHIAGIEAARERMTAKREARRARASAARERLCAPATFYEQPANA